MKINVPETVADVRAAFDRYEAALMADDVTAMDDLFRQAPETVRYGVGEVLYGYDEIAAFRRARGGSPQRTLGRVEITTYGDSFATANAEFFREDTDKRGRQSQAWVKFEDGWKIVSAHVSIEGAGS
ncbi:oxalurate catabolism protein HpxZ [Henriciella mobilis]|uniref:oxalurate catabolism protein HpxZ n=1 Tax=Henriciella mobilis TaxID=2305467 RepID=UPI000E661136|nr:oxalurate catabolism protein HpxZ [Henriciella mobilis]RIJ16901.1 oxalurate catabolism protein HpxZ [Henriciella mobilis]RIJ19319.1 oxalurate catabolism protein HpxZ [Henriciella mobilis]